MVSTLTEEEKSTLDEFIDAQFEQATNFRERPWLVSADDSRPNVDLEREYMEE